MSAKAKIRVKNRLVRAMPRYALAPVSVALALLAAVPLGRLIPHSAEYVFLLAVVACAWLANRGPGIVAAVLSLYAFDYYFLPPLHTLGIGREAMPYALPFLLGALGAAWMSATRHAALLAKINLHESEEKFRRILTNLPDVSWTTDQNRRLLYISPKIEGMLGYTSEEVRAHGGNLVVDRMHPEDAPRVTAALRDLFTMHQPYDVEFRVQKRNGDWIWVHNRAVRTHLRNGIVYADGLLSDITDRKRAELELLSKTALLEAQVNATIDGILVVDPNGRRILRNRRFLEMFQIPQEILDLEDDAPALEYALRLIQDPDSFLGKIKYLYGHPEETSRDEIDLKDGTVLDRYSAPVKDAEGKHYGRIWTFRDITQRRRNEEKLRQLSTVVEQSPVSVVITNPAGSILYVNRKFCESSGYSFDELLGKNPRILNSGYTPKESYKVLWDTILGGREWRGEFRNKKKNGEIFWESAIISPIVEEDGKISHLVAVKEDITKRRAMESELRQAQKLEGIGQLAAGIAHEINTPTQFVTDNLTFLEDSWKSVSKLLKMYREATTEPCGAAAPTAACAALKEAERSLDLDFIQEEVPRALAQSLDGARRVAHIVRAMKEFSHPDSADKIDTDLNKSIESTITVARNEWKYVAEMATDFDETLPPVFCYPGEVNQVVLNLVVNAAHSIKDKARDGEKGKITISTRQRGQFAEIAIADTGTGIPEAIQARIYEPFFTTKEVGKGTGQGLALAHSVVVKKHQGKIWFDTKAGQGTTFFIQLPIGQMAARTENGR